MGEFEQLKAPSRVDRSTPAKSVRSPAPLGHAIDPQVTNQAARRFAESCPMRLPSPTICPYGGACHSCPVPIQAKLTVNEPGDKYEQEADRIADEVLRMPEPAVQRACPTCEEDEESVQTKPLADRITPLVQRQEAEPEEEEEEPVQTKLAHGSAVQCQEEEPEEEEEEPIQTKLENPTHVQCQEEEPEEEEGPIQTKRADGHASRVTPELTARIDSLRGGGQPLSSSERQFFEPRFGRDLHHVRIHTESQGSNAARSMQAKAFTVGRNIVFGAGHYAPASASGRRLIAHELSHTIQQRTLDSLFSMPPIQRSICPASCVAAVRAGRLCRATATNRSGCAERAASDSSNRISHIRVLLDTRQVHLFWNGRPRTSEGTKQTFSCNPNARRTPRGWDKIGIKCGEEYTNRNRYNMAWFTAFRSKGVRYGLHDSQPLSGAPSSGCVRVSCELARTINQNTSSNWTSIMVRDSSPGD